mmetsp:Transcript_47655/g.112806  ORF Transcript_47655/g.112806 Transcript_47655/m.112806 type:complete len:252 (-) Transcript_47655:571-1326(-)
MRLGPGLFEGLGLLLLQRPLHGFENALRDDRDRLRELRVRVQADPLEVQNLLEGVAEGAAAHLFDLLDADAQGLEHQRRLVVGLLRDDVGELVDLRRLEHVHTGDFAALGGGALALHLDHLANKDWEDGLNSGTAVQAQLKRHDQLQEHVVHLSVLGHGAELADAASVVGLPRQQRHEHHAVRQPKEEALLPALALGQTLLIQKYLDLRVCLLVFVPYGRPLHARCLQPLEVTVFLCRGAPARELGVLAET